MCGIAGCVGHEHATNFVVNSLEALEYRGYDSAGIAYQGPDGLEVVKTIGAVAGLRPNIPDTADLATTAIGHTRWATHGVVSAANTHPHTNEAGTIAVVHNGTIENHADLRAELTAEGYTFASQTDTEVIPHLIDFYINKGLSPGAAFEKTIKRLVGAYAVLATTVKEPNTIYAARLGSPLVLGVNGHEHFAASDTSVLFDHTKQAVFLDDHEIATLSTDGYSSRHIRNGLDTTRQPEELSDVFEKAELGDFPHFMLKEIHDSPETIRAAISGRVKAHENFVKLDGIENPDKPDTKERLRRTERFIIVACGTSMHAGLIGKRLIEEIAGVPVEVEQASEFKYSSRPFSRDTAIIAVSQSGETADTIAALGKAKEEGLLTLGINNSPGSTVDRMTDAGVHCRAGREVSVASTKAFISQVAAFTEIALALAKRSNQLHQPLMEELEVLPAKIESILRDTHAIQTAAKKYADSQNFMFIGRGYEYASALEGALKLKEISYINANGIAAGEMKHGTIALIDEAFPTMAIATNSSTYDKTISSIEEIKARKGPVIALATEGNHEITQLADDVLYVPESLEQTQPILNAVALQLFAYYVAVEKGLNVDRPRNLAKSVTVE